MLGSWKVLSIKLPVGLVNKEREMFISLEKNGILPADGQFSNRNRSPDGGNTIRLVDEVLVFWRRKAKRGS